MADRIISGGAIAAEKYDDGGTIFNAAKAQNLASETPKSKVAADTYFYVSCDPATGKVVVYAQSTDAKNMVYPNLGSDYKDKAN